MTYAPTQLMIDWEKKLRTPGLVQTKGALCKEDADGNRSYCCLGVLEVVAGNTPKRQDFLPGYSADDINNLEFRGDTAFGETGLPSAMLIDKVLGREVDSDNWGNEGGIPLGVDSCGNYVDAAELNDEHDWTFEEIADQIRLIYIDGDGDFTKHRITSNRRSEYDCE